MTEHDTVVLALCLVSNAACFTCVMAALARVNRRITDLAVAVRDDG